MSEVLSAGVIFYVDNSSINKAGNKYSGKVALSATVTDTELWEQLLKQLNGMTLYKGSDMKTQIISVLQGKNSQLETVLEQTQAQLTDRAERAEQRASIAEADNMVLAERVAVLERELESALNEIAAG